MPAAKPDNRNTDHRIVVCKQCTLDTPLSALDLPAIRVLFAELTDAASEELFGQGLDFDDVIVDRYILADSKNFAKGQVPADWLSDRDRLIKHVVSFVRKKINASGVSSVDVADIQVRGLAVEIVQQVGPT